jgi:hypothetical protein
MTTRRVQAVHATSHSAAADAALLKRKQQALSPFASAESLAAAYAVAVPVSAASPFALVAAPRSPRAAQHTGAALPFSQSRAITIPSTTGAVAQKKRASTAQAALGKTSSAAAAADQQQQSILGSAPAKPRPHSGPLGVGMRPRAAAQAAASWAGVQSPPVTAASIAALSASEVKSSNLSSKQPLLQQAAKRAPLMATVGQRSKVARVSPVVGPAAPSAKATVVVARTRLGQMAVGKSVSAATEAASAQHASVMMGAAPYTILSPTSAASAAAAASSPAAPLSMPGRFDLFALTHDPSDHLLSLPIRRFVVGKLCCRAPSLVHFKPDRLCYMFAHPHSPDTQVMIELSYEDMVDLRCSPANGGAGAFSFKIPHFLPAFDWDYEPNLRHHRLTVEFHSAADMQRFKQQAYTSIQMRALRR